MQLDFVGGGAVTKPDPRQERNTRPTVAEEKAELALRLGRMCTKAPASVSQGGIVAVREWMHIQKGAMKLLKSRNASVNQLQSAISAMERFL